METMQPAPPNPRTLDAGRYALGAVLGEGAMAQVFEGVDQQTGQVVAIKVVHPHVRQTPMNVVRFQREAQILRQVAHPGLVTVLDAGEDEESRTLFLVMERLFGETLEALLLARRTPRRDVLEILRATLSPLGAAHEAGVVHRDLKPANVFVTGLGPRPDIKLLDFGIASLDGGPSVTLTEMTVGTPSYMAPEQATRTVETGPQADLWSVGVMLHRAIAGALPFTGEGAYDTVMRACVHPHPALPDGAPLALAALVDRCLEKEPGHRPESARAVEASLERLLVDPEVEAYLEALDQRLGLGASASASSATEPASTAPAGAGGAAVAAATGHAARAPTPAPVGPRVGAPVHRMASVTVAPEAALSPPRRRRGALALGLSAAAVLLAGFGLTHDWTPERAAPVARPEVPTARTTVAPPVEPPEDPAEVERARVLPAEEAPEAPDEAATEAPDEARREAQRARRARPETRSKTTEATRSAARPEVRAEAEPASATRTEPSETPAEIAAPAAPGPRDADAGAGAQTEADEPSAAEPAGEARAAAPSTPPIPAPGSGPEPKPAPEAEAPASPSKPEPPAAPAPDEPDPSDFATF